ncbi:DEAD/DEAH box helicase [Desulforamulus ruminis]|uniref:DEAD/DEAH box helicase n=1 Tax=Desulforamulus ruminis TaxID=1564 RepID=UPI002356B5BE|nr:DEAD/DEAH box helicase [Desulforamulus ruminis]
MAINKHSARSLTLAEDTIKLRCLYEDREAVKQVTGYRWNKAEKCWEFPIRPEVYQQILQMLPGVFVYPDVKLAVNKVVERENQVAQAKVAGWEKVKPVEPIPLRTKPFNHQVLAYNLGLTLPSYAVLAEQGTGKSCITVAVTGRRFLRDEIKRVLIVSPASVVPVWPLEYKTHADFPFEVTPLEGPVAKRIEVLERWERDAEKLQIAVVNYEGAWRMEEALTKWAPDMLVLDEAQRIKTPSAQQSKCMHRIAKKVNYRMILTGTPVTQGPLDFFSMYKALEPSIFGRSFTAFKTRYCIFGGYENRQITAYKNLPELIRKAHTIAFRVTKEEALDLPETTDQKLYCEMETSAKRVYRELVSESMAELHGERVVTAANVIVRLLRLSQVTGGFVKDDTGAVNRVSEAKQRLFKEVMHDLLGTGKKVVVFARFLAELAAIEDDLDRWQIGYSRIAGDVNMAARGEEVRRFQQDKDCRVFLAQTRAAGLGITLTAADTAIFYSLDYSFADYDQARCRIHRIGQRNACTYIHLLARDTVDEKVMTTLQNKRNVADEVVNNWRNYFQIGR